MAWLTQDSGPTANATATLEGLVAALSHLGAEIGTFADGIACRPKRIGGADD